MKVRGRTNRCTRPREATRRVNGNVRSHRRAMRRPESVQVFLVSEAQDQRSYLLFHRVAMPELALPDFW